MLIKSCPAQVKAVGDDGTGIFEAIVSVFGNKDSYGDVVVKGAFADDLAAWKSSGDPIPVYWSHRMDDPDMNIGWVLEAAETEQGLQVKAQLDLDAPKAAQVWRLLKGRRVTQFSFAYDVLESGWAKSEELGEFYELRRLHVHEVGPTPIGANQETELLATKNATAAARHLAAQVKAGRVLSAKNEGSLRTAHDEIGKVLAALDTEDDQEKASATGDQVKDEGADGVKSEDPARPTSAELQALTAIRLADYSAND